MALPGPSRARMCPSRVEGKRAGVPEKGLRPDRRVEEGHLPKLEGLLAGLEGLVVSELDNVRLRREKRLIHGDLRVDVDGVVGNVEELDDLGLGEKLNDALAARLLLLELAGVLITRGRLTRRFSRERKPLAWERGRGPTFFIDLIKGFEPFAGSARLFMPGCSLNFLYFQLQ